MADEVKELAQEVRDLGRRMTDGMAEMRTDLAGFYFNLIFGLCVFAMYVVTRQEALLVVIIVVVAALNGLGRSAAHRRWIRDAGRLVYETTAASAGHSKAVRPWMRRLRSR